MGLIQEGDVRWLLQEPELMSEMAKAVVETPEVMDSLADEIADELEDEIENATEFRRHIVSAAMADPAFRKRLAMKLIEDD